MADVVTHELIHAFDHCRAEVDLKNPLHLACTEVRPNRHPPLVETFRKWPEWNGVIRRCN